MGNNIASQNIDYLRSNDFDNLKNLKFCKFTNSTEVHHNFKYSDGLNILKDNFDEYSITGFYITTYEHIHKYKSYGNGIREITLPFANPNFRIFKTEDPNVWRTNMIILGKKYFLDNNTDLIYIHKNINKNLQYFTFENITINEATLLLECNDEGITHTYINYFVDTENLEMLNLLTNNISNIKICIESSILKEKILILDNLKQYVENLDFITERDIVRISKCGLLKSLNWLKENKFNFKFYKYFIIEEIIQSRCPNIMDVLEFYTNSDYDITFSKIAIMILLVNDICDDDDIINYKREIRNWFEKKGYDIENKCNFTNLKICDVRRRC